MSFWLVAGGQSPPRSLPPIKIRQTHLQLVQVGRGTAQVSPHLSLAGADVSDLGLANLEVGAKEAQLN